MYEFKVNNIFKSLNKLTYNTIVIPEPVQSSFGKVEVRFGSTSKNITCIIKYGETFEFSENILNKIFDSVIKCNLQFIIEIKDLRTIEQLSNINEIILNSVWFPFIQENYDFSNSIYTFFNSSKEYFSVNDYVKIPINFYDSTNLLINLNLESSLISHFFVKITSIQPNANENIFYFDPEKSKMIYNSKSLIYDKSFDIDASFNRLSNEMEEFQSKIIPILKISSFQFQFDWIRIPFVHVNGPKLSGKGYLIENLSQLIGYHNVVVKFCDVFSQSPSAMAKKFDRFISMINTGNYISLHFQDFDKFFTNSEYPGNSGKFDPRSVNIFSSVLDRLSSLQQKDFIVFLSTTETVPIEIDQRILVRHVVGFVNDRDRLEIIRDFLRPNENVLNEIMKLSKKSSVGELINVLKSIGVGDSLSERDLIGAFKSCVSSGFDEAGLNIEAVTWRDIGGQKQVIEEILTIVQLTTSQHKFVPGFKPRKYGILLYGEPGTGKTLIAKAVAYECSLNFISVKGPELLNMYVGQSEENVRALFARVRQMTPCLLFCDELDSLIPRRGFSGDSGGVMDRVVSQFSVEIDSINNDDDARVIIMGATNRPDLIDPALLRNGRFDRIFHIVGGMNKTSQLEILKSQTYKLNIEKNLDMQEIVNCFSNDVWTGARIYGLVSNAIMNSIKRTIELIESNKVDKNCELIVTKSDFLQALNDLIH